MDKKQWNGVIIFAVEINLNIMYATSYNANPQQGDGRVHPC